MQVKFLFTIVFVGMTFWGYAQRIDLFVGTYTTNNDSKGIYKFAFDTLTGSASLMTTEAADNPSFLAHSDEKLLAVNENGDGKGALSIFDVSNVNIEFLDSISSEGDAPCHVLVIPELGLFVVSNYSGGTLATFKMDDDSKKLKHQETIKYSGSGPVKSRQEKPHIHSAFYNGKGEVFVSDLGTDQIYVYQIPDGSKMTVDDDIRLVPIDTISAMNGGGPRHLAFNFGGDVMYSLQEISGQLAVYRKENGQWEFQQLLPIFQDGFNGENGGGDVKVSKDGKSVYATNRGDANVIVHYKVLSNGLLEADQVLPVSGVSPRNFNISPDGGFVLVANQNTDEIVVFKRDEFTGHLQDSGNRIKVPSPVCIVF